MNESTLRQNLKQEQSSQLETFTDYGKSENYKGMQNSEMKKYENKGRADSGGSGKLTNYSNNVSQIIQAWTPLLDELCKTKQVTFRFVAKSEVHIVLNNEENPKYIYIFNLQGAMLYYKDNTNLKEVAKILNDLVFLQKEGGRYERIGSIVNQIQCKKIKVMAWSLKTSLVFETGSNDNVNIQVIPCCFPLYKLYRYFQKDEVLVKDKNTEVIYSTYTTKSLKKTKQSTFIFSDNLTTNIDKLLSLMSALQYIEIIWFTRYSSSLKSQMTK